MAKSAKKYVYFFGNGKADGTGTMKDLLGGKGAGLANMTRLKIPVPAGFTITTEACNTFFENKKKYPAGMWEQVLANLKKVEAAMGMKFGGAKDPLLLSVRSGSKFSMPGMMDTVLNLGMNETTMKAIVDKTGNERFVLDTYRRLITMFGSTVMGIDRQHFEKALEAMKEDRGAKLDTELLTGDLRELVKTFKGIYAKETGKEFPNDPLQQLKLAINAVFGSWFSDRAVKYRNLNKIPHDLGTACNVQAMVFGNMGENSGTGVGFTRNPSTGEKKFFAEYLTNAQGEDVVAGIRTPLHIDELKKALPAVYKELEEIYRKLEAHYKDMLDIEFTVQDGKLYMLQTRVGKRTAAASLRIAIEMVKEKLIDKKTAIMRIDPEQLERLMHPSFDPKAPVKVIAKGLPASPGAAVGKVVFTAEDAEKAAANKEKVVLVRTETSPEDIGGMHAAQGILTARGGMTSHAAVVARGMGKCCVAGCTAVHIDEETKVMTIGEHRFREGRLHHPQRLDGGSHRRRGPARPPRPQRRFQHHHEMGRRDPGARGPGQRRHAGGRPHGAEVRGGGDRPRPHRAHVLRGRPRAGGARDDPGRRHGRPQEGARQDPPHAAGGFHRDLQGDERPAGDHPAARPAAARVPAEDPGGYRGDRAGHGRVPWRS